LNYLLQEKGKRTNQKTEKLCGLSIYNSQKKLVSKIILDGIALGIWDESVPVENVAMFYMGIPVSLNIELILSFGEFSAANYCHRMMLILLKILKR